MGAGARHVGARVRKWFDASGGAAAGYYSGTVASFDPAVKWCAPPLRVRLVPLLLRPAAR